LGCLSNQIARRPIGLSILGEIRSYQRHHLGMAIQEGLSHPFVAVQRLIAAAFIRTEIDPQDLIYLGLHRES
jgi:hypothetical protein